MTMAKPTRPRVGINIDFVAATKTGGAFVRLPAGYVDSILAAGGLPLLLPPVGKEPEIDALLDLVDGVVLCGGADVDPRRWGMIMHSAVQKMAQRRDENDRLLLQRIVARKLPVMAVGVGMQQLNLTFGGTLFLHLPEEQPRAMPHREPGGGPHRHAVLLEAGTRLDEIYGGGEIRVNSDHHQAVRLVGDKLRVSARAPDGVIEAVETTDADWFCVGVQWHPESETASALDMQLLESFIQACVRQSQGMGLAA
jgi:putative glutamine amidotransferase